MRSAPIVFLFALMPACFVVGTRDKAADDPAGDAGEDAGTSPAPSSEASDAGSGSAPKFGDASIARDAEVARADASDASADGEADASIVLVDAAPVGITIAISAVEIYPGSAVETPFNLVRNGDLRTVTQYKIVGAAPGVSVSSIANGIITFESDPFASPSTTTLTIEALGESGDVVASSSFSLTVTVPTFAGASMASVGFVPAMSEPAVALARAADGSIFTLSSAFHYGIPCEVARHHGDGSFDVAFGVNGVATVPMPASLPHPRHAECSAIAIQSDGGVLVSGTTGATAFVFRLTSAGALDPAFGATDPVLFPAGGGRVFTASGGIGVNALFVDVSDGVWLAGDFASGSLFLNHLLADGSDDAAFTPPVTSLVGTSLVQSADGAIYVGGGGNNAEDCFGTAVYGSLRDVCGGGTAGDLLRFRPDGSLDATFGDAGRTTVPGVVQGEAAIGSLALDLAGGLVIGGTVQGVCSTDQLWNTAAGFVTRLTTSTGGFDSSFGLRMNGCWSAVTALSIDADDRVVVSGVVAVTDGNFYSVPSAYLLDDDGNFVSQFDLPLLGIGPSATGPFGSSLVTVGGASNAAGGYVFLMESSTYLSALVQME